MDELVIKTPREGFINITGQIAQLLTKQEGKSGICQIFIPHTTAGVTVNENADPDVVYDMLAALEAMVPKLPYRHGEGNSPAHVKSSLVGCSVTVPVAAGKLVLGTWQGIYFCEFDGPRTRKVYVNLVGS